MLHLNQKWLIFNKCILSDENRTESIKQEDLMMGQHTQACGVMNTCNGITSLRSKKVTAFYLSYRGKKCN